MKRLCMSALDHKPTYAMQHVVSTLPLTATAKADSDRAENRLLQNKLVHC
jgi:hypothetical protein